MCVVVWEPNLCCFLEPNDQRVLGGFVEQNYYYVLLFMGIYFPFTSGLIVSESLVLLFGLSVSVSLWFLFALLLALFSLSSLQSVSLSCSNYVSLCLSLSVSLSEPSACLDAMAMRVAGELWWSNVGRAVTVHTTAECKRTCARQQTNLCMANP